METPKWLQTKQLFAELKHLGDAQNETHTFLAQMLVPHYALVSLQFSTENGLFINDLLIKDGDVPFLC